MPKFVNVGGVWKAAKTSANVSGIWKNSSNEYVNVNGIWRSYGAAVKKDLETEYNAGRIRISNSALGDTTSNIGTTVNSNLIMGWSQQTDHIPQIKILYHNPSILKFTATSNYGRGRHEHAFGALIIYIKTNGQQGTYTMSCYENRTFYDWNQVNNYLSVVTTGTWGFSDQNHTNTTANRLSAISSDNLVSEYNFELNMPGRFIQLHNHRFNLPADFAYATQIWAIVHGWFSNEISLDIGIRDLYVL